MLLVLPEKALRHPPGVLPVPILPRHPSDSLPQLWGTYHCPMHIRSYKMNVSPQYLLLIYKCRVSVPNNQLGLNPLIV